MKQICRWFCFILWGSGQWWNVKRKIILNRLSYLSFSRYNHLLKMDYIQRLTTEINELRAAYIIHSTNREPKSYNAYTDRDRFNLRLKTKSVLSNINLQLNAFGKLIKLELIIMKWFHSKNPFTWRFNTQISRDWAIGSNRKRRLRSIISSSADNQPSKSGKMRLYQRHVVYFWPELFPSPN